jgi:hypothetical protein
MGTVQTDHVAEALEYAQDVLAGVTAGVQVGQGGVPPTTRRPRSLGERSDLAVRVAPGAR